MKRLAAILDDAACHPDGCERLRVMANRWEDRARRWNGRRIAAMAYSVSQACIWRSLAIAKRDYDHVSDAIRYERYSDDAVNDLRGAR